jgi:hypothetical protein
MRYSRRTSLDWLGAAALTVGMLLSGCGAASTAGDAHGAPTKTPAPWPTVARTPTPTSSIVNISGTSEEAGCPTNANNTQLRYVSVGALTLAVGGRRLDYPSERMPSNVPSAPYQLAAGAVTNYAPNPPINPILSNGYLLQICNQTSTEHVLSGLRVNIANFTPSSGPVNTWHICEDGPYNAATKQTATGCGGALGEVMWLQATLPADYSGASAPAIPNAHGEFASLPMVIVPNHTLAVLVAVDGLTSQGTYTLSFSVSVDGAAPAIVTPSDGPFFIAPAAVVWTGTACQAPTMQAHISAAAQDSYYVCPPAS